MVSRPPVRPDDTHDLDFTSQSHNNEEGTACSIIACDRCSPIATDKINQDGGRLRTAGKR
jgi:hypothetical protein